MILSSYFNIPIYKKYIHEITWKKISNNNYIVTIKDYENVNYHGIYSNNY